MTRRLSIRARLLLALAMLALATVIVGATSWITLRQATERLDHLHDETLASVQSALTLSAHASDLATRAPWLLTLPSPFRIAQEAQTARALIADMAGTLGDAALEQTLHGLEDDIDALVAAATARSALVDRVQRQSAILAAAERRFAARAGTGRVVLPEARDWLSLRRVAGALIGAGRAQALVSVGEFQRDYHRLLAGLAADPLIVGQADLLALRALAEGPEGLFETRRLESARQIEAEAALARIRRGAEAISLHAAHVTAEAQARIAAERARTLSAIAFAKGIILGVGLFSTALALLAAWFVSGHVTANLRAISDAMMRLAAGDRTSRLPRGADTGDEIGKLLHAFRTFRANILRLDRSHRQLAQRNALFENLYEGMSDGLAILSEQGTLIAGNSRLATVLRLDPARVQTRLPMESLLNEGGWQPAPSGAVGLGFDELHHASGALVELRKSPLATGGSVMLFSDASERRELETRLARIQRTEALGKIAGEVAHDFGNILSTISTSLHLMETAPPERAGALRQSLSSALDLGLSLTQRLLAFARRLHLEPEVMDLNALAEGVEDLIQLALEDRITLRIEPAPLPLKVRIDPGQMESALLNLCLNAAQAIDGEGHIRIALAQSDDGRAEVRVIDTGRGMSPEVLAHATEPFFTARADGTGTGLGLATVYGFIRQSGGDLKITSAPGAGTTVRLLLPLHQQPAAVLPAQGRVLLVEDNPADAAHARRLLAASDLCLATSAADGLALIRAKPAFDLVLTDLHFGLDPAGWRIAEAALIRDPRTRVAVVSGRMPAHDPVSARYPGRIIRLTKPLDPAALAGMLTGPHIPS